MGVIKAVGLITMGGTLGQIGPSNFCGQFDNKVTDTRIFFGNGTTLSEYGPGTIAFGVERVGVVYSFTDTNVTSKVGMSFISISRGL